MQPSCSTRLASLCAMQISELARQASVSVDALRHYERLGLIRPHRRANGYRDYPASIKREVVFIAMSRQLGFALPQIARRLDDYRAGTLGIDDWCGPCRSAWPRWTSRSASCRPKSRWCWNTKRGSRSNSRASARHPAPGRVCGPGHPPSPPPQPHPPGKRHDFAFAIPLAHCLHRRIAGLCAGHAHGPHARAALCPCRAWPGRDGNPGE
ncbi:MAG: MerR family DNA-binding transcriptional regulator [Gammaproteobacteria bacterium]